MAYDANPAATFDPTVGGTPTAAWLDIFNANFAHLGAAWTSFTPTWTGSGGNPAIGNGTLSGAYLQVGKTLHVRYWMKAGSTTTFGTGTWYFTVPNSLTVSTSYTQILTAYLLDAATLHYTATARIGSTTGFNSKFDIVISGTANAVAPTQPFTWTTSDELVIEGTIEVA